jgi:hypothetical protein
MAKGMKNSIRGSLWSGEDITINAITARHALKNSGSE